MAFTGSFVCHSYKLEREYGMHDFDPSTGDTFYMALYDNTATLTADTTAYTTSGEITGTGYVAGGVALTSIAPVLSGSTVINDFADAAWPGASFTARGALIYNSTPNTTSKAATNPAIVVIDFGADKTASATTFTVVLPSATASTAIVRSTS